MRPRNKSSKLELEELEKLLLKFKNYKVGIEFHGGEPLLMGKRKFEEYLSLIATYKNIVKIFLQTNGVLLDDEYLNLIEYYCPDKMNIGISLDGLEENNRNRYNFSGKNSFNQVCSSLKKLNRRKIRFGVLWLQN